MTRAGWCGKGGTARCPCPPYPDQHWLSGADKSRGSSSVPMTALPSRSAFASFWRACGPYCDGMPGALHRHGIRRAAAAGSAAGSSIGAAGASNVEGPSTAREPARSYGAAPPGESCAVTLIYRQSSDRFESLARIHFRRSTIPAFRAGVPSWLGDRVRIRTLGPPSTVRVSLLLAEEKGGGQL